MLLNHVHMYVIYVSGYEGVKAIRYHIIYVYKII